MMSYPENIPFILKAFADIRPKRVLDVGPGFGKYGLLFREHYLGLQVDEGVNVPTDDIAIDAIDITKYFLDRKELKAIYNDVWESDFRGWQIEVGDYDLVTLIDVVEHYPKEEMYAWILKQKVPVLISTPKETVMYKRELYDDPHVHQSQWTDQDTAQFKHVKDFSSHLSHIFIKFP